MNKRLALIALLILTLALPVWNLQNVSASTYPQIISVERTPLQPTPDLTVNVTFQVIDKYGITNDSLYYAINDSSNFIQIMPVIIDGDFNNGTFAVQIPKETDNTTVVYYVEVRDTIGYIKQSLNYSYFVSTDITPPVISDPQQIPDRISVLPTENVTIEANITDTGSGVKNAILFYGDDSARQDPFNIEYNQTSMFQNGSDTNTYIGTIPPFPNGTFIYFFIGAYDNANNSVQQNSRYNYLVKNPATSNLLININVQNIYQNNLTAAVAISIEGTLPSVDGEPLIIQVSNHYPNGYDHDLPQQIRVNPSSGFWYQQTDNLTFGLIGDPAKYPFDTYTLNLTFNIYWYPQPQSITTQTFTTQAYSGNVWTGSYTHYLTTENGTYTQFPVLVSTLTVQRYTYGDVFPLVLLIIMLFFLLGGTLILDSMKLSERLTVILAIFILIAGVYFNQSSFIPVPRMGFTIAERLFLSLVGGSAIFAVASMIVVSAQSVLESFRPSKKVSIFLVHNFGLILDGVALLVFALIWLPPILGISPVFESFLVICGLSFGYILKLCLAAGQHFTNSGKKTNFKWLKERFRKIITLPPMKYVLNSFALQVPCFRLLLLRLLETMPQSIRSQVVFLIGKS